MVTVVWGYLAGHDCGCPRLGRRQPAWFKARSVLVIRPLLALVLLIGAATGPAAGSDGATVALGLLALACLVVLLVFAVFPIPIPAFAQPRWYRRSHGRHR